MEVIDDLSKICFSRAIGVEARLKWIEEGVGCEEIETFRETTVFGKKDCMLIFLYL